MEDVKKAYAWQEAIELSTQLVKLIEEFSDADTNVLVWHLRQAVVDIPSGVAADLQATRKPNLEPVVRLATELELVQRIYPAVDTTAAEEQLAKLLERLSSKEFAERVPEPEPQTEAEEASEPETNLPVQEG